MEVGRFDVFLVELDPVRGAEMRKTRPCLVLSPDELNGHLKTVIVAPMTSTRRSYPCRVNASFQGLEGQVAIDQLRVVDKSRLRRRLGEVRPPEREAVLRVLADFFAP